MSNTQHNETKYYLPKDKQSRAGITALSLPYLLIVAELRSKSLLDLDNHRMTAAKGDFKQKWHPYVREKLNNEKSNNLEHLRLEF